MLDWGLPAGAHQAVIILVRLLRILAVYAGQ
jgi:hypothetical protein